MSWKELERQIGRGPISALGAWWKILIFVLILAGITTCGIAVVTKPFDVIGGTLGSDNVKHNYEWFKTRHESIRSLDVKIKQTQGAAAQFKADAGSRDKWHREDRQEHARLSTILLGLKQERSDQAGEYNARSRMVNRSIFKGKDTPLEIPLETQ